jgi:hypothetical protein
MPPIGVVACTPVQECTIVQLINEATAEFPTKTFGVNSEDAQAIRHG